MEAESSRRTAKASCTKNSSSAENHSQDSSIKFDIFFYKKTRKRRKSRNTLFFPQEMGLFVLVLLVLLSQVAGGPVLGTRFASQYRIDALGFVPSVPSPVGALAFDPVSGVLLVGGSARTASGRIYSSRARRNAANKIIKLDTASLFRQGVGAFNDGGVVFTPTDNVLLLSRNPENSIGQVLSTSNSGTDKIVSFNASSSSSIGPLAIVPSNPGLLKLAVPGTGQFFSAALVRDTGTTAAGAPSQTYSVLRAALSGSLAGRPQGLLYVTSGSGKPGFSQNTLLVVASQVKRELAAGGRVFSPPQKGLTAKGCCRARVCRRYKRQSRQLHSKRCFSSNGRSVRSHDRSCLWRFSRLFTVDRCVSCIRTYELRYSPAMQSRF